MPTVIILSSSPPSAFARSPTPVELSSPRNTLESVPNGDTPSRRRFKAITNQRDGFSGSFSTARQVLAEKNSEVNKLFSTSPGRNKFKGSQRTGATDSSSTAHEQNSLSTPSENDGAPEDHRDGEKSANAAHATDGIYRERHTSSPLIVQRAVSRRKDWTPPRPDTVQDVRDMTTSNESGFPNSLLADFGYNSNTTNDIKAFAAGSDANKRRKLAATNTNTNTKSTSKAGNEGVQGLTSKSTSVKRSKSPAKKPLTITGLATSNFLGNDKEEDSPMLQYLTSTQEQETEGSVATGAWESKVKQTKAAVAKIRGSKRGRPKSLLVSPSSALKHLEEQETVFGSASQFWTAEPKRATNQSNHLDSFSFSDPFSSPPLSQANSIDTRTPQAGISRFKQSRNLWAAAGRDEDNALLHVDTVDLTDSPDVRAALAGKDAMIQPNVKQPKVAPAALVHQPSIQLKRPSVLDIDDIITPGQSPSTVNASFHTTAHGLDPRKKASSMSTKEHDQAPPATASNTEKITTKKVAPKKPHFAGLSDHDLKKQISAYGFKAIRKREKMIELLEKCWAEKHGSVDQPANSEAEKSGFGDILSHIHDVSARPMPKEKKVTRPRKKKDDTSKAAAVKKPRQRKTKSVDEKGTQSVTKTAGKRKSKANIVSDEFVYDIEDLNDPAVKERRELGRFDNWAMPPKTPNLHEPAVDHAEPPTPPLSFPGMSKQFPEALEDQDTSTQPPAIPEATSSTIQQKILATPDDSQQPDIYGQITRAINHESFTSNVYMNSPSRPTSSISQPKTHRNHQTHPTWHEKILMYDPIVLEDLATWLNTKGLSEIGEDREVGAVEVRTWCESRGICCLWKGGWRGTQGGE